MTNIKRGQRREGLYYGIFSFSRKVAVALAVWLVGIILSGVGYAPNAVQDKRIPAGHKAYLCRGDGVFFLFASLIMAYLLPMTRKRHEALAEAIRLKKEGTATDEEENQNFALVF